MIYETSGRPDDRLHIVLHLGDFIYEIVWYPGERPQGYDDRRLRDIVRYPNGEKISDFHVPTTVADYRAVYRAYLQDPDLQEARARWQPRPGDAECDRQPPQCGLHRGPRCAAPY